MATYPGIIGLHLLDDLPYGAYAVDLSQTVQYWNRSAERITGHQARDIIGRKYHQALQNLMEDNEISVCPVGCPSLVATRENRIPPFHQVRMLCSSGQRKLVVVTPLTIASTKPGSSVLIYLFDELADNAGSEQAAERLEIQQHARGRITSRELEVLRLNALGLTDEEIANKLYITYNTARNHIASLRRKLSAKTKLELAVKTRDLGLK